ncbi:Diacetyl reductase [(S)-acetoin forming] [Hypsizygus marmoreus]|uniref:Diacetyl reductase [(S)-acetoin forming] n=1 Tax=Hypsizygus marmoreus TaxID=39966 RepID=A0A369K6S7_HYPMA|nr:Diacetyl reductase [(S)-acetoin forming] [Hypsizygus marmoreus]
MSNSPEFTFVRVALITGGAQGIGRAIALRLAADGLDVAVDDIPSQLPLLEEVVAEVQKLGRKAIALTYDVSKEEDVQAMVDKTVSDLGRLDVMVANAGISGGITPIMDADIAHWESVWAVNIRGPLLCYKYAAKQMVKQGQGGRIIGASSICGKQGFAGLGAYCASKATVRSLTQTASLEFAEHGITVNAYAPGMIETDMTKRSVDSALGGPCAAVKRVMQIPDAKVGQADVVAGLVSYLAAPESHFITGQTISIDGGIRFD